MRFQYRLAGHLGKTRAALLDGMSAIELVEWRLIEGMEPFGERRMDWRFAIVAARLLRVQGSETTAADVLADLMDVFESPVATIGEDEATQARMESAAMAWAGIKPGE